MNKNISLPPIKNYSSRVEWEMACWQKIINSKELLRLLVTPQECHDLVMRAVAIERLINGKSYRQIGEELWLSSQTISGIKKALERGGYRSYFERSKKERRKRTYSSSTKLTKPRRQTRSGSGLYGYILPRIFPKE